MVEWLQAHEPVLGVVSLSANLCRDVEMLELNQYSGLQLEQQPLMGSWTHVRNAPATFCLDVNEHVRNAGGDLEIMWQRASAILKDFIESKYMQTSWPGGNV